MKLDEFKDPLSEMVAVVSLLAVASVYPETGFMVAISLVLMFVANLAGFP